jgi:hypothetical protein
MDITTRNFFRLLRAGAFGKQEKVEPMSACKWRKTMQLAIVHGVEMETYQGIEVLSDQFFIQRIPADIRTEWANKAYATDGRVASKRPELNKHMQKKMDDLQTKGDAASTEYAVMEQLVFLANALLTDMGWVKQLLELGEVLRERSNGVNREQLETLIKQLGMIRMVRLESALLVELMGMQVEELPFFTDPSKIQVQTFASAIPHGQEQLRFSQGKDIFVHTSNVSAVLWNARRSARFFRFDPLGSVTNLISSFTNSLTNIEE